jgi:hypothetical protein
MISKILYFLAGVDPGLMQQVSTKERSKYITIGGLIFFTGTVAGLTGGFAAYSLAKSIPVAVSLGSLWGSGIVLLDKAFVSGIDKKKDSIKKQVIKSVPRIFLSCTLGFIIGQPVAVMVARTAINDEINRQEKEGIIGDKKSQIKIYEDKNKQLRPEAEKKKQDWKSAEDKVLCEYNGTCGSSIKGTGTNYKRNTKTADDLKTDYEKVQKQINKNEEKITELNTDLNKLEGQRLNMQVDADFFKQWEILLGLTKTNPNIKMLDTFITILFILIEICPVTVKLMSEAGSYDNLVADEEEFITYKSQKQKEVNKEQVLEEIENEKIVQKDLRDLFKSQFSSLIITFSKDNSRIKKMQENILFSMFKDVEQQLFYQTVMKSKVTGQLPHSVEKEMKDYNEETLKQMQGDKKKAYENKKKIDLYDRDQEGIMNQMRNSIGKNTKMSTNDRSTNLNQNNGNNSHQSAASSHKSQSKDDDDPWL